MARVAPNVRRAAPVCEHCFAVFYEAFVAADALKPIAEQQTDVFLRERARNRAKAVRFRNEWCCPRCTKLSNVDGQEVFLDAVYKVRCRPRTRRTRKEI